MISKHLLKRVAVLLAAVLMLSVPLQAQTGVTNWSRINSVDLDSKLKIKLKSGKSIEGDFARVSDATISLKVKGKMQEIKREDVQTVHRVVGKSVMTATLIGTGIGAGMAGALGAIGSADSEFDKLDQAIVAGMVIVGAIIGTVAGYFIGRTRKKKILVYSAL
jgi:hypothetical protein